MKNWILLYLQKLEDKCKQLVKKFILLFLAYKMLLINSARFFTPILNFAD